MPRRRRLMASFPPVLAPENSVNPVVPTHIQFVCVFYTKTPWVCCFWRFSGSSGPCKQVRQLRNGRQKKCKNGLATPVLPRTRESSSRFSVTRSARLSARQGWGVSTHHGRYSSGCSSVQRSMGRDPPGRHGCGPSRSSSQPMGTAPQFLPPQGPLIHPADPVRRRSGVVPLTANAHRLRFVTRLQMQKARTVARA